LHTSFMPATPWSKATSALQPKSLNAYAKHHVHYFHEHFVCYSVTYCNTVIVI
jgi:hypothetical protein